MTQAGLITVIPHHVAERENIQRSVGLCLGILFTYFNKFLVRMMWVMAAPKGKGTDMQCSTFALQVSRLIFAPAVYFWDKNKWSPTCSTFLLTE